MERISLTSCLLLGSDEPGRRLNLTLDARSDEDRCKGIPDVTGNLSLNSVNSLDDRISSLSNSSNFDCMYGF
jgi:hypothetical protein